MDLPIKYGLMIFNSSNNIGDWIISVAVRSFLPRVDVYVDREKMSRVPKDCRLILPMSYWMMHSRGCFKERNPSTGTHGKEEKIHPKEERLKIGTAVPISRDFDFCVCETSGPSDLDFPPPSNVIPVFVSLNISNKHLLSEELIGYFRKNSPVFCRDRKTLKSLQKRGVKAFFSGCITLTLEREKFLFPGSERKGGETTQRQRKGIYFVDCKVPGVQGEELTHNFTLEEAHTLSIEEKFKKAEGLLQRYATAEHVYTSRIHCYLPCVAFGTPVTFLPEQRAGENPQLKERPEFSLSRLSGLGGILKDTQKTRRLIAKLRKLMKHKLTCKKCLGLA